MSSGPVMTNGQPNPTGTGRYCLPPPGTCYCSSCPHYRPLPAQEWWSIPGSREHTRWGGKRPRNPRRAA